MPAKMNLREKVFSWFDERFQISPLVEFMRHKQVPVHRHTIWYYMGGVTLFLFVVQVVSGILLVLYYKADENAAFESVWFIMTKVQFGWLVRSIPCSPLRSTSRSARWKGGDVRGGAITAQSHRLTARGAICYRL